MFRPIHVECTYLSGQIGCRSLDHPPGVLLLKIDRAAIAKG